MDKIIFDIKRCGGEGFRGGGWGRRIEDFVEVGSGVVGRGHIWENESRGFPKENCEDVRCFFVVVYANTECSYNICLMRRRSHRFGLLIQMVSAR